MIANRFYWRLLGACTAFVLLILVINAITGCQSANTTAQPIYLPGINLGLSGYGATIGAQIPPSVIPPSTSPTVVHVPVTIPASTTPTTITGTIKAAPVPSPTPTSSADPAFLFLHHNHKALAFTMPTHPPRYVDSRAGVSKIVYQF